MRKAVIVAALLLASSQVQALEISTRCTHSKFFGNQCSTSILPSPAVDSAQEAKDAAAREEADKKWIAFCQPQKHVDSEGVIRLSYAKKGCEFGRNE